jgi:hypothetical protein
MKPEINIVIKINVFEAILWNQRIPGNLKQQFLRTLITTLAFSSSQRRRT